MFDAIPPPRRGGETGGGRSIMLFELFEIIAVLEFRLFMWSEEDPR